MNRTVPSCGTWAPKNCECYKQCQSVHCHSGGGTSECEHHLGSILGESRCFLYRGRSSVQQDSGVPRNGSDDVDWYQVPSQGPLEWLDGKPRTEDRLPEHKKWFCKGSGKEHVTSLEDCPQHCSSRGVCVQSHHGGVRCVCRMGFKGLACELDDNEEACWFSPTCNGHGKCKSGFCHCDPGWWGLGCTRSSAYALEPGSKAVPSRHRLKIYMYDIPSEYTFPGEHEDGDFQRDVNYIAYEYFLRYFLYDWEVRTQNPYEANLFFIPMLVYFYVHNVQNPYPHIQRVVRYVSTSFPFWNRTGK
ncbi:hypothetical protein CEUSTIGMA_g11496.t1 [Chlamydomonas eustigma]|uniref:EGF-like domain-containing protein n=1 Tax=Chlamydomonas eustigma TaxID=1157962 RepID=A0A250XME6_9CHLO|nr:hypothetical protein CEUSTIGMA_g11496.t1 [Chlamydomonas eustigma]|eukprot:GAX84072.1 hypothetical protein CEUSTIGMA_g11496.t1 [Chlamydomonas eustigma]